MRQKFNFNEEDIPKQWYNIASDLPRAPQPPIGPDGKPITPDMPATVFPMNLIEQEVSLERWIDIPEEVLEILYMWRPAPLRRTLFLEKHLKTPAGQRGSALAFACNLLGLECKVFMVRISFDQKPFRKTMMQIWGANRIASPSKETNTGYTGKPRYSYKRGN